MELPCSTKVPFCDKNPDGPRSFDINDGIDNNYVELLSPNFSSIVLVISKEYENEYLSAKNFVLPKFLFSQFFR